MARAQAVRPQAESSNVYLPHQAIAPWVESFIDEGSSFPNGKYDDQVDQMTQVLNRLRGATCPSIPRQCRGRRGPPAERPAGASAPGFAPMP